MSESNAVGTSQGQQPVSFIYRHRKAIVATVVSISTAVSAYYVYKQLQTQKDASVSAASDVSTSEEKPQEQTATPDVPAPEKKKKSKKKGKTTTVEEKSETNYPVLASGEPDIDAVLALSKEEQETITLKLKENGNEQFKLKDFNRALDFYNWALKIKVDPIFYSNISACYVSLNDLPKVVEYCNKALELKPDYSKVLLRRASAYESMGNYEDAMFDLSVLSLNNDFNGASIEPILERNLNKQALKKMDELVTNMEAENGEKKQLPSDTSLASFFNMLTPPELEFPHYNDQDEDDVLLHSALESLYKYTHNGFKAANEEFTKVVIAYKRRLETIEGAEEKNQLNLKLSLALQYLGIFQFLQNDMVQSEETLKESIDLYPRVYAYVFAAMIAADRWATSAMRLSTPGASEESLTQADVDALKQQYLSKFKSAIELDPRNSVAYYHRGQIGFISQNYAQAREDFAKSIELNPENVFPYIQLACISYREGNFEECEKQFNDARTKFPLAPEIPMFFAELLTDRNELTKAMKEYDIAIKLEKAVADKGNGKIHVGVGPLLGKATVLAKQQPITPENFQLATELFQSATDIDPANEQAIVGLAQMKLQQEDVDTSIELFEKAAKLTRTHEERLQAITFAEAAKIQKKIRADPVISQRVEEALAQYRAQGLI